MLSTCRRQVCTALSDAFLVRRLTTTCKLCNVDMPPCDHKPKPYKGKSYEEMLKIRKNNLSPALTTFYKEPILFNEGYMQWLYDHTGKRYLDLFAGIVTISVGHCHPKISKALKDQVDKLWHTTNIYLHPQVHDFAEKLTAKMPGNLKVVYFVNSGSEANDLAMLLCRLHTGRYNVLSLRNAFHGTCSSLLGLTALRSWRFQVPAGFGIHQTINPDVYRGPFGGAHCRDSPIQTDRTCDCNVDQDSGEVNCKAGNQYIEQLEDVFRYSQPSSGIAGFFSEAIQGVGGTVQFPKNYLKQAFELVRKNGGLCISDEVQAGLGRLGSHYWGFESHGVIPDIVTMAKGLGNGMPLAAVVTTPEIAASLAPDKALHFNTFGGNPLSCAVGSAVLDAIEEDNCQETSRVVGTHFLQKLNHLKTKYDCIGDVRGKGLMIGIEMVKNRKTREALPIEEVNDIWDRTKDLGILLGKGGLYGSVFRIKPPMCITKEDANFAVDVIDKAIADHLANT